MPDLVIRHLFNLQPWQHALSGNSRFSDSSLSRARWLAYCGRQQ